MEIEAVNDAPELTGDKAELEAGHEDVLYTIKATDLLQGWSDEEGDTLSIKNLQASTGEITDLGDGNWALRTPQDFNGKVDLSYSVADVHGAATSEHSLEIEAVNDAPENKSIRINIETDEIKTVTVSRDQLLSTFDVDGDQLRVKNVQILDGSEAVENEDGSWIIETKGENGEYKLVFDVTDGKLVTKAEAEVRVKHKPIFTTFEFLTSKIEAAEGNTSRLSIRRIGDTRTQQKVK